MNTLIVLGVIVLILLLGVMCSTPNNFLDDISQDEVYLIRVSEYMPNRLACEGESKSKTSYNEKINSDILTYLRGLDTLRITKSVENMNLDDINFEYHLSIKNSSTFFTIYCYLDDLSTIGVHSNDDSILPGDYKIVNGGFDYEHINKLISEQNQ